MGLHSRTPLDAVLPHHKGAQGMRGLSFAAARGELADNAWATRPRASPYSFSTSRLRSSFWASAA
ncbi:MAG: hypothetical protein C4339_05065 [Nitrososphaerota archaeon]